MINPYYDSEKFGWEVLEIKYGDMCSEFDILVFWKTNEGAVFMAHDSGCSCPDPFEKFESDTEDGVKNLLERVSTIEQAKEKFFFCSCDEPDTAWNDVRAKLIEWGIK